MLLDVVYFCLLIIIFSYILFTFVPNYVLHLKLSIDRILIVWMGSTLILTWVLCVVLTFSITMRHEELSQLLPHVQLALIVGSFGFLWTSFLILCSVPLLHSIYVFISFLIIRFIFEKLPRSSFTFIETLCALLLTIISFIFSLYFILAIVCLLMSLFPATS